MSEWLESAIARAQGINDWLAPKRAHALELLANTKWPTRKTEAWRYTPLRPVERTQAKVITDKVELLPVAIAGLSAIELVFVNGQFDQTQLTKTLPEGVSISLGSDLDTAQQAEALHTFSTIKPERHIFGLVNDALAQDVVVVTVAEGVEVTQPIRISSLLSQGAESHTRVQVTLAAGSRLTVIEDVQAQGDSFNTAFVEYKVADRKSVV